MRRSINPIWNQRITLNVTLKGEDVVKNPLKEAPPIIITILDKDKDGYDFLGCVIAPLT